MNIVTICSTDWLMHLNRFLYFATKSMPSANIYVLVIINKARDTKEDLASLKNRLMNYVKDVKFASLSEMPGRLMFYDAVRSTLLDVFNLSEALYLDADADILQDISDIPALDPKAAVMAALDPLPPVRETGIAFQAYNIPMSAVNYQIGILYMRQSFKQEFEQIMSEHKIPMAGAFMPGSAVWNVILHRHKAFVIPETHHACWQRGRWILKTKVIHFNGPIWQQLRLHCSYPTINPNTIQFNPEPVNYVLPLMEYKG